MHLGSPRKIVVSAPCTRSSFGSVGVLGAAKQFLSHRAALNRRMQTYNCLRAPRLYDQESEPSLLDRPGLRPRQRDTQPQVSWSQRTQERRENPSRVQAAPDRAKRQRTTLISSAMHVRGRAAARKPRSPTEVRVVFQPRNGTQADLRGRPIRRASAQDGAVPCSVMFR
jgi:hypothetical protein